MLPAHYGMNAIMQYFHAMLQPVKWIWWRVVELMFKVQFGLRGDLVPKTPIEIDLFTGGQILTYEFSNMLRKKQLAAKKGSIDRYTETGVVLTDGTTVPADLVIYGTGFKKNCTSARACERARKISKARGDLTSAFSARAHRRHLRPPRGRASQEAKGRAVPVQKRHPSRRRQPRVRGRRSLDVQQRA